MYINPKGYEFSVKTKKDYALLRLPLKTGYPDKSQRAVSQHKKSEREKDGEKRKSFLHDTS